MAGIFLRNSFGIVTTCALALAATACSSTSGGGGGGVYYAKDGTSDTDASGSVSGDSSPSDTALPDTTGVDSAGGKDALVVEIVDKTDVQTGEPDVTIDVQKTDVQKPDVQKSDTAAAGKCVATSTCDPVANDCPNAGESCDIAQDGSAGCYPPPNSATPGGACSNANGPFCQGGYHCGPNSTCQKFCCSSADCNGGACTPIGVVPTDTIGICDP